MDASPNPELEARWQVVQDRWDDSASHEAFLAACHEQQALGVAAAKYRAVIDGPHEDRRAAAQKRIHAVALLATQALQATREPQPRTVPRWLTIVAAMVASSAVGWLLWALMK